MVYKNVRLSVHVLGVPTEISCFSPKASGCNTHPKKVTLGSRTVGTTFSLAHHFAGSTKPAWVLQQLARLVRSQFPLFTDSGGGRKKNNGACDFVYTNEEGPSHLKCALGGHLQRRREGFYELYAVAKCVIQRSRCDPDDIGPPLVNDNSACLELLHDGI